MMDGIGGKIRNHGYKGPNVSNEGQFSFVYKGLSEAITDTSFSVMIIYFLFFGSVLTYLKTKISECHNFIFPIKITPFILKIKDDL